MKKRALIITDKDLSSKMLTGIELRCLQMRNYFQSIGLEVVVWQPEKNFRSNFKLPFVSPGIPKKLQRLINQSDFIYSSLTSSKNSTIYKIGQIKTRPPIILDLFTPLLLEKEAAGRSFDEKRIIIGEEILQASFYLCATPRQLEYNKMLVSEFKSVKKNGEDLSIIPFIPPEINQKFSKKLPKLPKVGKKIFWIGAFYPWFDEKKLLELISQMKLDDVCFIIIGGKNPKTHAFDEKYLAIYDWAIKQKLIGKKVFFVDWLPYRSFQSFIESGDLAVLFVKNTSEDHLAIRSRLLSAFMAEIPVITNGEDELTGLAKKTSAAYYFGANDTVKLAELVRDVLKIKTRPVWRNLRKQLDKWAREDGLIRYLND